MHWRPSSSLERNVIESQKRTIGELDFELSPLPAWKALETWTRVIGVLAPGLNGLNGLKAKTQEEMLGALARAIQGLASTNPAEIQSLSKVLLETCLVTVKGQQAPLLPVFDVVMQGRMLSVFKLLAWAVEVNYADFFDVARAALADRKLKAKASALMSQFTQPTSGPATD